jgi:hypothetical protein
MLREVSLKSHPVSAHQSNEEWSIGSWWWQGHTGESLRGLSCLLCLHLVLWALLLIKGEVHPATFHLGMLFQRSVVLYHLEPLIQGEMVSNDFPQRFFGGNYMNF